MTGDLALIMFPVLIGMIFLGFPVAFSMMLTALGFGPFNNGPLVSASEDGTLRVWDVWRGACLRTLRWAPPPARLSAPP